MDIDPVMNGVDPPNDWRSVYVDCLDQGTLPTDRTDARRNYRHSKSFIMIEGELYKCNVSGIKQRCVLTEQGIRLLEDIHTGVCGHRAAPKTLVGITFWQRFHWSTTVGDATCIVRSCQGC